MRLALAAFASVVALATAACGSSDDHGPGPATTDVPGYTSPPSPSSTPGSTPSSTSPCGPDAASCTCVKISRNDYDVSCNTPADCVPITRGQICGTAQDAASNACPAANTVVNKDSYAMYDQDRSSVETTSCAPSTTYPIACVLNRCVLEVPSGDSAGGGGGDDDGTGVVVIDYGDDDDDDSTAGSGDDGDDTVVVVTGDDDDDDQGSGSSSSGGDDDDDDTSSDNGKRPHALSRTVYHHHHRHHTNDAPLAHSPPVTDVLE